MGGSEVWNLFLERHFILDIETIFRRLPENTNLITKSFWLKKIENKRRQLYLGNKKQKETMSLVVSPSDPCFGFLRPFFSCPIGDISKIEPRKIGHDELNLSRLGKSSWNPGYKNWGLARKRSSCVSGTTSISILAPRNSEILSNLFQIELM